MERASCVLFIFLWRWVFPVLLLDFNIIRKVRLQDIRVFLIFHCILKLFILAMKPRGRLIFRFLDFFPFLIHWFSWRSSDIFWLFTKMPLFRCYGIELFLFLGLFELALFTSTMKFLDRVLFIKFAVVNLIVVIIRDEFFVFVLPMHWLRWKIRSSIFWWFSCICISLSFKVWRKAFLYFVIFLFFVCQLLIKHGFFKFSMIICPPRLFIFLNFGFKNLLLLLLLLFRLIIVNFITTYHCLIFNFLEMN